MGATETVEAEAVEERSPIQVRQTDNAYSENELRLTAVKNNKPKRPVVENFLLCHKEVRKMLYHLTNEHSIDTNDKLRKFNSPFHSTLETHRC